MKESSFTFEGLATELQTLANQILAYLPKLAIALLVLLLGWMLAKLGRLLIKRAIARLDSWWSQLISKKGLAPVHSHRPPARMIGELIFWLILLIFITLAAEILGLESFGSWLKTLVAYLPLVVGGMLIVLVGFVVSSLARDLVVSAASSAGLSHVELLARTVQIIILFIAVIIGVDQIGIDIGFLTVVAAIILATMLGGVALAFGLGAKTHVSNIIAANQLRQIYHVGDSVRIGDLEGTITDITVTRVLLENDLGNMAIPAKIFDEQVTTIIERDT